MIVGIDPTVDYVFKRLFGRQQSIALLIALINAVLQEPPERQVISLEILNPFQDKDFQEDKLSVLDIKARDASGRQFNIEMQVLAFAVFRLRVLYYWARLHQGQLPEGEEYGTLRPTVSICIVGTRLFPELPGWHSTFELRERGSGILFSDQLAIHVLELPKFVKPVDDLASPLERWMYFLCHGKELDPEALPASLNDPAIQRATGELKMMSQSELERDRYEARLKWQRDHAALMSDAREQGLAEGEAKGRAEGEARARASALAEQVQRFQRMLRRPEIAADELRQRPLVELEELVRTLEKELTALLSGSRPADSR